MRDIDQMDILRYLDVLARELEQAEDEEDTQNGENVIELRRGTIDMVLG